MPDRKAQLPFQDLLSYEYYYNTGIFFLSNLFHRKKMTPFDNSVTVQPCEDSDRKKVESSSVCTCVNQIYGHGELFYGKEKALYRDGWVQGAFFFRN